MVATPGKWRVIGVAELFRSCFLKTLEEEMKHRQTRDRGLLLCNLEECQFDRDLPSSNQDHGNQARFDALIESGSLRNVVGAEEGTNVLDSRQPGD